MADLPDYYTQAQISEAEAARLKGGLDANKSPTPVSRDIYIATDTHILYVCITDGAWTGFDAATLTQGILTLYANMAGGGFRITNIADPLANQDAATGAFVLAIAALYLALAGGTMTGNIIMGGNKVTGLGAPTAQDHALRYGRAEIRNAEIAAAAAIAYSKLNLTGAIKAADIEAAAGIPLTKLEDAVCSEAEASAIAQGALDYPMKQKLDVVRYVIPGWYIAARTTVVMTANRIFFIPIFVEETTTYIRIGIEVTALSAGSVDLRIFEWDAGLPGALVLSAGTVDPGTTGVKEIVIAQELTRGYYYLAARFDSTPACRCPDIANAIKTPVAGFETSLMTELTKVILVSDQAYADPATAPYTAYTASYAVVSLREN